MSLTQIRDLIGCRNQNPVCGRAPGTLVIIEARRGDDGRYTLVAEDRPGRQEENVFPKRPLKYIPDTLDVVFE